MGVYLLIQSDCWVPLTEHLIPPDTMQVVSEWDPSVPHSLPGKQHPHPAVEQTQVQGARNWSNFSQPESGKTEIASQIWPGPLFHYSNCLATPFYPRDVFGGFGGNWRNLRCGKGTSPN